MGTILEFTLPNNLCNTKLFSMEAIIGNVDNIEFLIEIQLEEQAGVEALPFSGMDKSGSGVCNFYLKGNCQLGNTCPFRHLKGDRTIVCKHWLRGLCKKGDDCEFLHEYDMSKMPECYFHSKFGQCLNKECPFLHIDPDSKLTDCLWYDRGFCRNGPNCKNRHVKKVACQNFINGFCPDGKLCKYAHPKFWPLPSTEVVSDQRQRWICHHCGERGHKIQFCHKLPPEERQKLHDQVATRHGGGGTNRDKELHHQTYQQIRLSAGQHMMQGHPHPQKPINEVTCYKCGERGHYANRCPKGHLAFLSKASEPDHMQVQAQAVNG